MFFKTVFIVCIFNNNDLTICFFATIISSPFIKYCELVIELLQI